MLAEIESDALKLCEPDLIALSDPFIELRCYAGCRVSQWTDLGIQTRLLPPARTVQSESGYQRRRVNPN